MSNLFFIITYVADCVFLNDCNNISPIHLVFSKVTLVILPPRTVICVPHPLESEWGLVPTLTNRVQCKWCYITSRLGLYKDTHPRVILLLGCEFQATEPAPITKQVNDEPLEDTRSQPDVFSWPLTSHNRDKLLSLCPLQITDPQNSWLIWPLGFGVTFYTEINDHNNWDVRITQLWHQWFPVLSGLVWKLKEMLPFSLKILS